MAKILIADDEPEVVQFCAFALQKLNHTIITAESGPEAMRKLKDEKPDLLLLDIMLPGMDGYTLQLQMAQNAELSRIPVIIISVLKPAQPLFEKFEQISGFLAKPFPAEELVNSVEKVLNKAKAG